jgi:mersacidin/lichenicidin family type 2 lantibiotic
MDLSKETILRAWKDDDFRNSLSEGERNAIPARPTAEDGSALTDEQLEAAAGGTTPACAAWGLGVAAVGLGVAAEEAFD